MNKIPCKPHTGALSNCGYGQVRDQGRTRSAHVVAYERAFGPVPPGLEVSHLCKRNDCVEPTHLVAETHAENCARDRVEECGKGHRDFVPHGSRQRCRPCHNEQERQRRARRKVSA